MAPAATTLAAVPPTDTFSWKGQVKTMDAVITSHIDPIELPTPLTIDELIRQRSEIAPHDCIVSYPSSGIEYVDYTFRQLDVFASRVAHKYKSLIPQRSSSSDPETVVGLLGSSNLEYLISILALTKLGHTVLFLSTRISTAAYSSLLETTGAKHIIYAQPFRDIIAQVKNGLPNLQLHDIVDSTDYDNPVTENDHLNTRFDQNLQPEVEATKISWIIHSSGSTGLPKPIYQTHKAALNNYASNLNLRGFITLPLYHAHGISSVFRALHSRKQIYMYNATLPLTQQHLLDIMHRYDFQIFYGVPYALKILGETTEGIAALAKLKVVMFGGSACPDALGDRLVDHGVNLISHYGT
jgi:acyl-CoA synthetase (AMP-forming)/AMP-acid ligase II